VNLKEDVAAFDLSALLADHKARNRASELDRARKITLAERKAQAKKSDAEGNGKKSAGTGKKSKKASGSRKRELEEFWDEDDEIEEEELQNRRDFERGREVDSEDGSDVGLKGVFQARDASKRPVKQSVRMLFDKVKEPNGASSKFDDKNKKTAKKKAQKKVGKAGASSKSHDKIKKSARKKNVGEVVQGLYLSGDDYVALILLQSILRT